MKEDKYVVVYGPYKEVECEIPLPFDEALESMKKHIEECFMEISKNKSDYEECERKHPNPIKGSIEYDDLKELKDNIEDIEFFCFPVFLNSVEDDYSEDDLLVLYKDQKVVTYDLKNGWNCIKELIPVSLVDFKNAVSGIDAMRNDCMRPLKANNKEVLWYDPESMRMTK